MGLGRGFGVHKALDQIGAFAGPLLVAGVIAVSGVLWPALAVLALPGALTLLLLARLRRVVGEPAPAGDSAGGAGARTPADAGLRTPPGRSPAPSGSSPPPRDWPPPGW